VELCHIDGRRAVYTLGCADPFYLDEPNCPVVIGKPEIVVQSGKRWLLFALGGGTAEPLERPALPKKMAGTMAAARKAYDEAWATHRISHGWRGPR
jgi:hypothetical protein